MTNKLPIKCKSHLDIPLSWKTDLLSLCKSGIIRADYVGFFYDLIPDDKQTKDCLSEPDLDEDV